MIVSKEWLAEYVDLSMPMDELTDRLTITGLNLEGIETVGADTAIDLEVTSNRPDCLGHIGVAREVAVIFGKELKVAAPDANATGSPVEKLTSVTIEADDLCPRYTARVIKGVKIGPSPDWLANRLRSLGIAVINNVVDITNYVMMEIGQPLHAFDFAKLKGGKIVVRHSEQGEAFTAIDHKTYTLTGEEVVIADAERPVALGGVMGGYDTEVTNDTVDVLIEAADFDQMAVRGAARRHVLMSPSSYRFERGVDPEGIDWASRRCCELILELAGGELCEGVIDEGTQEDNRPTIKLRYDQIPRILGIEVERDEVRRILTDLGCEETHNCDHCVKAVPPTWRADLTREADLLEEVARIHGYDRIPEDVGVRMAPSHRTREDVVLERVRHAMTAAGFDEALTLSAVDENTSEAFAPWTTEAPLATGTPVLRRANRLRQSVVPSLLECRRTNETQSNPTIELFEIAKVYLPKPGALPDEKRVLALTSGGGFREVKGVVETLLAHIAPDLAWSVESTGHELLDAARSCQLMVEGEQLGVLGELSQPGMDRFNLRGGSTIAEIDLAPIVTAARLVPTAGPLSSHQPVSRDLNVVLDESVRWADVERIARAEAGALIESISFQDDSYRDPKQLGEGKKSVLFSIVLRKPDGAFTSEEADAVRDKIVAQLGKELGGKLRA
ncbi:Phenylalanine--tRNA ligase beta subunit [Posidoniimonas corsicana]|uniref:Phenylalanine--tRNA ligase beta subunit n=1 Tax=Posidoniimonas corsicana TaxID=1938618 RepID=A0A5C5V3E9_9BACT|nr:phenylalanine--tRNA ligase subunit beta [Posidoniimonas corsicana]TWT32459.1 Phenylalanine--tRNA ligase beta subunit [Posidoniimonas corsicana]